MSKIRLLIITSLSILVILVIGVVLTIQLNNPTKFIKEFESAIEENNPDVLKEMIVPDKAEAPVDEKSVTALLNYLKTNHHSYQVIKDSLYKQIDQKDYSQTNQQISLIKADKKGVMNSYKLLVKTSSIKVSGQNEDDKVTLNIDQSKLTLKPNEEGQYGPVLPGAYPITVTVENNLGDFHETKNMDVWGNDVITYVVDTEKLVKADDKTNKNIIDAVDTFNYDMTVFETNGFSLESFTNLDTDSWDMEYTQYLISTGYTEAINYIEEIHSRYDGASVNLDDFTINYFDGQWSADVTVFVSYDRKMKFVDLPDYEDLSYDVIRDYSLVFDEKEKRWLIFDFIETEANGDEYEDWKETLQLEGDADGLKWIRTNDENPLSNL